MQATLTSTIYLQSRVSCTKSVRHINSSVPVLGCSHLKLMGGRMTQYKLQCQKIIWKPLVLIIFQGCDFSAFGLNSALCRIIFSCKFNGNIQKRSLIFCLFSPKCHCDHIPDLYQFFHLMFKTAREIFHIFSNRILSSDICKHLHMNWMPLLQINHFLF